MPKIIRTLNELGLFGLDGQLHLYNHLTPIEKIHKNVLIATTKPVLYSNDFDARVGISMSSFDLFVKCDNFLLFGGAFAPHQVTYFKSDEFRNEIVRD